MIESLFLHRLCLLSSATRRHKYYPISICFGDRYYLKCWKKKTNQTKPSRFNLYDSAHHRIAQPSKIVGVVFFCGFLPFRPILNACRMITIIGVKVTATNCFFFIFFQCAPKNTNIGTIVIVSRALQHFATRKRLNCKQSEFDKFHFKLATVHQFIFTSLTQMTETVQLIYRVSCPKCTYTFC